MNAPPPLSDKVCSGDANDASNTVEITVSTHAKENSPHLHFKSYLHTPQVCDTGMKLGE